MSVATAPKTEFRLSARAALGAIDAEKGFFKDVSLMTEGEALGHGCYCDQKTLQSVFALAQTSAVKAYLTHGNYFEPDRLGDEVGLFSGIYLDGAQLKAKQFTFFKAFKQGNETRAKYEALMELAAADPGLFGVSLSFSGFLVWAMKDGTDMPVGEDDSMPEGCALDMPSVRVTRVFSADFVSDPAANKNGLFNERSAAAKLLGITLPDLKQPEQPAPSVDALASSKTTTAFTMLKEIRAKFTDSAQFARACELFSANEKLTVADIEVTLSNEAKEVATMKLKADFDKALADIKAQADEIAKLKTDLEAAKKGAEPVNLGLGNEGGGKSLLEQAEKLSGAEFSAFYAKNRDGIARERQAQIEKRAAQAK